MKKFLGSIVFFSFIWLSFEYLSSSENFGLLLMTLYPAIFLMYIGWLNDWEA